MRGASVLLLVVAAGCLNGDYNAPADMSIPDMAKSYVFDLSNYDLFGLYNCSQLNACEQACTTKVCIYNCRNMATPTAVAKEIDFENCATMYCPTTAGGICEADANGMLSAACKTCINNTQATASSSCSPSDAPECQKCSAEAQICLADQ